MGGEFLEGLGHDGGAGQDGHEVGVALPARHDMNVKVPRHPGAGDLAQVDADVEPIRFHHICERVLAAPRELEEVGEFVICQPVEVS